ncbi:MAG TPA: EAL domain-containing protein [Thermotogota bacterium]|nr:EAL domain-containing protein [Thermotogota bacterium]
MSLRTKDYYELVRNLHEGYAYHRMIYDNDGNPVDYVFLEVNEAFLNLTGQTREEVIGKTATQALKWIKKNHIETPLFDSYGTLCKEGGHLKYDSSYYSDYDKWLDLTVFSTGDGYFTTLVRDSTMEKLLSKSNKYTEERYHTILETAPVAILEVDVTEIWHVIEEMKRDFKDFNEVMEQHPEFYVQARSFFKLLSVNDEAVRVFKARSEREFIEDISLLFSEENDPDWKRLFVGIWENRETIELELKIRDFNGDEISLFVRAKVLFVKEEIKMLMGILNVTHIKSMEVEWEKQQTELMASYEQMEAYNQELKETQKDLSMINEKLISANDKLTNRERQLQMALQSAREALWILEEKSGSIENIGNWQHFLGFENLEFAASFENWLSLIHDEDKERVRLVLQKAFSENEKFFEVEYRIRTKNGTWLWALSRGEVLLNEDGSSKLIFGTHQDISRRKEAERRLDYLVSYDPLTGLPNKQNLMNRFHEEIERNKRNNSVMAVLALDLDGFKRINESMGHTFGDRLLSEVSSRLRQKVRTQDFIARSSSDEFIIIFPDIKGKEKIAYLARNLLNRFEVPFCIENKEVFITASIGIAIYPDNGENEDTLLKKADLALIESKKAGKNTFRFYNANMNSEATKKLELETRLHKAIEQNQFLLYYQPQFDLKTNSVVGVEALIRWCDPDVGIISPGEFMPIAEETGLILPIGDWVLSKACYELNQWKRMGIRDFRMSVNISPLQFAQENFLEILKDTIIESNIDPKNLMLEITESILMDDIESVRRKLHEIKDLGCSLSIDDFGTGYSSLAYLRKFPIDELKIDKSFVLDLSYPDNASIVKTIISLANNLNMSVIAEGIEEDSQYEFLIQNNCNMMQGYLFGHPMSHDQIEEFLKEYVGFETCLKE